MEKSKTTISTVLLLVSQDEVVDELLVAHVHLEVFILPYQI